MHFRFFSILVWFFIFQTGYSQFNRLPLKASRHTTIETEEGTFMNLDVSPANGDIVFQLLGNIFLLPKNEKEAIQLTNGLAWDSYPIFSPDGKRIAFISDRAGYDMVYTMNTEGNDLRQLKNSRIDQAMLSISWQKEGLSVFSELYSFVIEDSINQKEKPYVEFKLQNNAIIKSTNTGDSLTVHHFDPGFYTSKFAVSNNGRFIAYVTLKAFGLNKDYVKNELVVLDTNKAEIIYSTKVGEFLCYFPNFSFSEDSQKIIIPYDGKIHAIDFKRGFKEVISFHAAINVDLAKRVDHPISINNDSLKNTRFRWIKPYKNSLLFSSLGKLKVYKGGKVRELLDKENDQYFPVLTSNCTIIYTSWNREGKGYIWQVNENLVSKKIIAEPGLYKYPAISKDEQNLVFLKSQRNYERYEEAKGYGSLLMKNLKTEKIYTLADSLPVVNHLSFSKKNDDIHFMDKAVPGKYYKRLSGISFKTDSIYTIAELHPRIKEAFLSPSEDYLLFTYDENLYLLEVKDKQRPYQLKEKTDIEKAIQITFTGAYDPSFLSKNLLSWSNGDTYNRLLINSETLDKPKLDHLKNDIVKVTVQEKVATEKGKGIIAFINAEVITMNSENQVFKKGTIVIKDDRILKIGNENLKIPEEAQVINLEGKVVVPGFIDMHLHDGPPDDVLALSWDRFVTNLAFGITTIRDPSVNPDYDAYELLSEAGEINAPRLFGAAALTDAKFHIDSLQDARDWVQEQKKLGAKYIKVHDAWNRMQRQYLVKSADEAGINIIGHPDASNYAGRYNLSILLDGFTSWEHLIPFGRLYNDAQELIAFSKTGYTLTGIGMGGEFPNLRKKITIKPNEGRCYKNVFSIFTEEKLNFKNSMLWPYINDAHSIQQKGGKILIGSHGDIPGVEFHWELWSLRKGGMTPLEALRAATKTAAEYLGVQKDLGSLEKGKIADLIILNGDPRKDITQTMNIHSIMKNGIIYPQKKLFSLCDKLSKLHGINN